MRAHILEDDVIRRAETTDEVRRAYVDGKTMWIDLHDRTAEADRVLREVFSIHPLVAEDMWLDRSVPKIDEFDDYTYIVVHSIARGSTPTKVELRVVDVVVGKRFVITQQRDRHQREPLAEHIQLHPELLAGDTSWLLHRILDDVVDGYLPFVEGYVRRVDEVEHSVLVAHPPDPRKLEEEIFALRRTIQMLARITHHQREILAQLALGKVLNMPKDVVPYFRDVSDHFVRVAEDVDRYGDAVNDAMDAYLSMQSNHMNQTMKTLTLMTTCLLPMNLIASIYGMNFQHMPELSWPWGYPFALAMMASIGGAILLFFKTKRWF